MMIHVFERASDCAPLGAAWNTIVEQAGSGILGLDATATFEWTQTLWEQRLADQSVHVLVCEDATGLGGILPIFVETRRVHGLPRRIVSPVTEIYSNRCGFVVRELGEALFEMLLKHLFTETPGWDTLKLTLVEGSVSDDLLRRLCARYGHTVERSGSQHSPYFDLDGTWETYFAALPKKFRWTLRSSEKRMRAEGELAYREVTGGAELDRFLDAVHEIEQGSWKEAAGTSLTANEYQERFHRAFAYRASERGWFRGQLLELNGEPIAYIYGLVFKGVFQDFKESFKEARRDFSPGHVLKMLALERLYERGVRTYDFMGLAEPYKLRWADRQYTRSTYCVYHRTLRGRTARWATSGARLLKSAIRRPV